MGERTSYPPGTFSWVDLATTDPAAAKAFYGRLFGWDATDMPAGDAGTYTLFRRAGRDVAGAYAQPQDQRDAGAPPQWLSHVTVDDVDASAARVPELGGSVIAAPFDVLEEGRIALIADPTGGVLALWEPRRHVGAGIVNEPGALTWNDLRTPDPDTASRFYRELLGWDVTRVAPDQPYWTVSVGGRANGGIMEQPPQLREAAAPAAWNAYFAVDDLHQAITVAQEEGASVLFGPMDVPSGRFATLRDPQGAAFSVSAGEFDD